MYRRIDNDPFHRDICLRRKGNMASDSYQFNAHLSKRMRLARMEFILPIIHQRINLVRSLSPKLHEDMS
jgi:hypothetical protein